MMPRSIEYHRLRAANLCSQCCGKISDTSKCPTCLSKELSRRRARRMGIVAREARIHLPRADILELRAAGWTIPRIAAANGVGRNTIQRRLTRWRYEAE